MDVTNANMALESRKFKGYLQNRFTFGQVDIAVSFLDTVKKSVSTLSSDYAWHLSYWKADLDLSLPDRLIVGIQSWDNYSRSHQKTLLACANSQKLDICTTNGRSYVLLSISTQKPLSFLQTVNILSQQTVIFDYCWHIWQKKKMPWIYRCVQP